MKTINTRQRIILLVLPLFALPVILAFSWAHQEFTVKQQPPRSGINALLPEPQLEQKERSKMELYELEDKAENRRKELIRMDPYMSREGKVGENEGSDISQLEIPDDLLEARESDLMEKLGALERQLSSDPEQRVKAGFTAGQKNAKAYNSGLAEDVARLESMMDRMQPAGPDPELEQLEGMLNKILDVQHPERIKEQIREKELAKPKFTVMSNTGTRAKVNTHNGAKEIPAVKNGFYGLEDEAPLESPVEAAIAAELAENTLLEGGGRVKIRLLEEVTVNGLRFPSGSIVYGQAIPDGNRMGLKVTSMRSGNRILPVELLAYDGDAMPGIPINGSLGPEIQQEAGDALVSGLPDLNSGLTLETQMASAGVSAAKGLFRKKNKTIKVILKSGHPILLLNQTK